MMVLGHSSVSFSALSRLAIWPPPEVVCVDVKTGIRAQQAVHLAVDAAQAVVMVSRVQAVILTARWVRI